MKLSEIFTQLTYGELSQLSIGGAEAGLIDESNHRAVMAHIQLGLTALHKRFPLREERMILALEEGKQTYPITGNVLKIERVYTDKGWELGLNDESDPYSCFTPSAQVLRVATDILTKYVDLPNHLTTVALEVVYRANHPIIEVPEWGLDSPDQIEINLPYSHLEPLLLFVASRVYNPIGMVGEFNAGNNYAMKYEASCQQLEMVNLRVDQGSSTNSRLIRNGWV